MKYVVNVCGAEVVLGSEQFERLVDVLRDAQLMESKYVGNGKGDDGGNYAQVIEPFNVLAKVQCKPMPDDMHGALELKTKLLNEAKS